MIVGGLRIYYNLTRSWFIPFIGGLTFVGGLTFIRTCLGVIYLDDFYLGVYCLGFFYLGGYCLGTYCSCVYYLESS